MKSETSFRVFFLKQHRKNGLKNIFFPSESVFLDFSFWPQGHRSTQNAHCALQIYRPSSIKFMSNQVAKIGSHCFALIGKILTMCDNFSLWECVRENWHSSSYHYLGVPISPEWMQYSPNPLTHPLAIWIFHPLLNNHLKHQYKHWRYF